LSASGQPLNVSNRILAIEKQTFRFRPTPAIGLGLIETSKADVGISAIKLRGRVRSDLMRVIIAAQNPDYTQVPLSVDVRLIES
jgi:hypothetical protein